MTHAFRWGPGRLAFRAAVGEHRDVFALPHDHPQMVSSWVLSGTSVPAPGAETVHINLWLYEGRRPSREHEVVLRSFSFAEP